MGITEQEGILIGGEDVFSEGKESPFLYANLEYQETSGIILADSSGNGHNMTWNPAGTNSTPPAGLMTGDGLSYGAATNGDGWIASSSEEFPFENQIYSSIYVHTFTVTGAMTQHSSLLCKRGALAAGDGGFQHYMPTTLRANNTLHGADLGQLATVNLGLTEIPAINEKMTVAFCFDAVEARLKIVGCGDSTASLVQYADNISGAPTGQTTSTNMIAMIGARSESLQGSELANNIDIHHSHFYHDFNGGALPANLFDIVRWLHDNPNSLIPAKWWS